ncbi:hypothetical protein [Novosphingobium sp. FSW06-99]|uniref:hypothetical protein n=1 Tax=Novosphingobium sp. FSW06-99 TaxID=1739113 RepID=UPI00076D632F|nr:hypothetical protein [Novosphingobium sp. FSW06-99]KUR80785.1 hypothetical protein AQZ49_01790 [Novosphingobium sp. FSW06-99]
MAASSIFDDRVMAELVRAAALGAQCPTNPEIADRAGMRSPSHVSEVILRLERNGLIAVYRGQCTRKVVILATGQETGGPIPEPHWRQRPADARKPASVSRHTAARDALSRDENLAARIEADQARMVEERARWLAVEQQRYRLPRRGRMLEEMIA